MKVSIKNNNISSLKKGDVIIANQVIKNLFQKYDKGTLFLVLRTERTEYGNTRIIGWEVKSSKIVNFIILSSEKKFFEVLK